MTWYIRSDLKEVRFSKTVPRREFDLIEFIKKVKEENEILTVEFDEENHIISFGVVKRE